MLKTLPAMLCACFTFASAAAADTLHVNAGLATGANDGSSWADAFQGSGGVQAALAAAVPGDDIFVAQGSYLPTATLSRTVSFALINGVSLYGSFLGTESSPAERPPFGTAPSVLSGDLAGNDGALIFSDNSFHIVTTAGSDATAVLDGFVISSGAATGAGGNQDRGGGILCVGAVSPTVRNCRFVGNRSTFGGGAGYINNGAAPSFTDCSFEDGVGGSFGGAFDIAAGGAVRFERCRFTGNTAARAGALEIFSSTGVVVNNCVFFGNTATGSGGGGGLWLGSGGNPQIRNCTIVGNTSTNQTVAGLRNQGSGNAAVVNCILWGNTGPGGAQAAANQVNAATLVAYSIVQGGFTGTGILDLDPLFVNLAGGDLTPTAGSPGIDAGSNADVPAGTTLDLSLQPRFADVLSVPDIGAGTAPIVDMGAHEFPSAWVDLGSGLAGASGVPVLLGTGTLEGGSPGSLAASNASALSPAVLFLSFASTPAPFKGGTLVTVPVFLAVNLVSSAAGDFVLPFVWPAGVPSGVVLYFQCAIQDGAAPQGASLSNALRATTP